MTQSFEYDGDALLRVRSSTVQLTESADQGAIGTGRLVVNDVSGTLEILGQMDLAADQDDCANPVLFRGFSGEDIEYERGPNSTGASREITISAQDLNAMLGHVVFDGDSEDEGDRPAETVDERLAWFETWCATNLPALFFGTRIGSSDHGLDANNFKDQHPSDLLAGIILAAESWNYYVRDFGTGDGPELVCRNDNTSTDDNAGISISNVPGEADFETVFPPLKDFKLTKRSANVGSRIRYSYASDTVTEERPATAAAFNGRRDLTASDSTVKSDAIAHRRAQDELWQNHTEDMVIEGSLLLTPETVNLACQGDRIGVRLQHLQALGNGLTFYDAEDLIYCRILERQWETLLKPTRLYKVKVKLSPQEEGPPAAAMVQQVEGTSGEGGVTLAFANPVTIGNLLVVRISDRSGTAPAAPNTGVSLPRWGAGAWTQLTGSPVDNGVGASPDGCAVWYKVADATDQSCYFGHSNAAFVANEIADGDIASATIVTKDNQSAANPMTIGSLGSPVAGSVCLLVGNWYDSNEPPPDPADPTWTGAANGWTTDLVHWFRQVFPYWGPPVSYFAHQLGDGSAISASGTRNGLFFGNGKWCGIALSIPPA